MRAAETGNIEAVKRELTGHTDVNAQDEVIYPFITNPDSFLLAYYKHSTFRVVVCSNFFSLWVVFCDTLCICILGWNNCNFLCCNEWSL